MAALYGWQKETVTSLDASQLKGKWNQRKKRGQTKGEENWLLEGSGRLVRNKASPHLDGYMPLFEPLASQEARKAPSPGTQHQSGCLNRVKS